MSPIQGTNDISSPLELTRKHEKSDVGDSKKQQICKMMEDAIYKGRVMVTVVTAFSQRCIKLVDNRLEMTRSETMAIASDGAVVLHIRAD